MTPRASPRRCRSHGGWLHDVGKTAIPDRILDKPGPLDEAEWRVMRAHTDSFAGRPSCPPRRDHDLDVAAEVDDVRREARVGDRAAASWGPLLYVRSTPSRVRCADGLPHSRPARGPRGGSASRARWEQATGAAGAVAAARQRGAQHRPADRRAVGRTAAGDGRQDAARPDLAAAEGA